MAGAADAALIQAIRTATDAVAFAREQATASANGEALETLRMAQHWLTFTLRRLGDPRYTGSDADVRYGNGDA